MASIQTIARRATSSVAASVFSAPVRVGGKAFSVHVYAPAANLVDIEISEDGLDWQSATDARDPATPTLLETLENEAREVFERPQWARFEVRTDAAGPAVYTVLFNVRRDNID